MLQKKEYFPALTGLRAIAALYVFFNHQQWLHKWSNYAERLHNEFYMGVGIFFVLSGFLISWHNIELRTERRFVAKTYLIKRWARIYPLWMILTILTFLIEWGQCNWECFHLRYILLNLTFTQTYFADALFSGIAQGWSLCVEAVFYIIAIWLVYNRKYIFWVIPAGLILGALYLYMAYLFPQFEFLYSLEHILLYTFAGRSFEFIAGAYLAEQLFAKREAIKIQSWPLYTSLGALGTALIPFILVYANQEVSSSIFTIKGILLHHLLLSVIVPTLILGLATEHSWLRTFLSSAIMEYAGKASFAFYLIHIGVIQEFVMFHFPVWLEFPLLCLASAFLYSFVEDPLRKWIISKS